LTASVHARSKSDAKGKKAIFQGEKRFFQRGMLFFLLRVGRTCSGNGADMAFENKGMLEI
jgi:hypothetical protein